MTRPICSHAYVGAARPGGASPLDRRVGACFIPQGDDITREMEDTPGEVDSRHPRC